MSFQAKLREKLKDLEIFVGADELTEFDIANLATYHKMLSMALAYADCLHLSTGDEQLDALNQSELVAATDQAITDTHNFKVRLIKGE